MVSPLDFSTEKNAKEILANAEGQILFLKHMEVLCLNPNICPDDHCLPPRTADTGLTLTVMEQGICELQLRLSHRLRTTIKPNPEKVNIST